MGRPINQCEEDRQRLNEIGYQIRGAIFEVYNQLGPGLMESIYEEAMVVEGKSRGLRVIQQVPVIVYYKGNPLKKRQRIGLLVEDEIIVELKSVEALHPQHFKQLTSQLKSADKRLGYLVNFNCAFMKDGENLFRIVNKL
ncbi:MAG: GxxExxY protein [Chitinophagaceae bacterium]|nr:MAG: GxxExxY protein [Chitinophagaceae bacterium]